MKKLLALVLCVMMFVAIIPTAAFADDKLPQAADPTKVWPALSASKTAVENAQKNIDHIYGTLAANNAVFDSIKSIDSMVGSLTKSLLEGVDEFEDYRFDAKTGTRTVTVLSHDTLVDNAKAYLRGIIGNSIIDELNDNRSNFVNVSKASYNGENIRTWKSAYGNGTMLYLGTGAGASGIAATDSFTKVFKDEHGNLWGLNPDGKWYLSTNGTSWSTSPVNADYDFGYKPNYTYDPVKYVDEFAKAASKALTSEKATKGLERVIYNLYVLKAMDQARDDNEDFWTEVSNWDKDNAILKAYGFNGTDDLFDLYAFDDSNDLPKSISLPGDLFTPGDLDVTYIIH